MRHILPWTKEAVDDAYTMSKLTIKNIDVIETHDCFTSSEYACISAFGLCKPGREYEVVESGMIDFNGKNQLIQVAGLLALAIPLVPLEFA